ncbi:MULTISPECIES: ABC transporter substrate-binding protein [unclassified Bradyrhizobium]|uniref:ABC transporter substrate-binding protein n=1 Tax=unclassified Bradyrhizobium TaxID=2631580 RepID=UPI0033980432
MPSHIRANELLGGVVRRLQFVAQLSIALLTVTEAYSQSLEPNIGFMSTRSSSDSKRVVAAFIKGLQEAGFDEGRNVSIEYRFADGALDRLPEIANDLVRSRVKVIVAAGGANSALAAKAVSATTPIVFVIGADPIKLGLAASLSRPGSNATGMTIFSAVLGPKRLELLRELVPKATVFAALTNPNTHEGRAQTSDMSAAAQSLGLKIHLLEASNLEEMQKAFTTLAQLKADALLVGSDPIYDVHRDKLVAMVAAAAIPAIFQFRDYAVAGGLMSYDPDIADAHRLAGVYVGRILKGANVADLPIQQPIKFRLAVNLKDGEDPWARGPSRLASAGR